MAVMASVTSTKPGTQEQEHKPTADMAVPQQRATDNRYSGTTARGYRQQVQRYHSRALLYGLHLKGEHDGLFEGRQDSCECHPQSSRKKLCNLVEADHLSRAPQCQDPDDGTKNREHGQCSSWWNSPCTEGQSLHSPEAWH